MIRREREGLLRNGADWTSRPPFFRRRAGHGQAVHRGGKCVWAIRRLRASVRTRAPALELFDTAMALVPALDLRPASNDVVIPHAPANIEAEQALLGALLYDNAAFERLGDHLQARHFFEPFHQRLYASIESNIRKGQLAEPILIAETFARDV